MSQLLAVDGLGKRFGGFVALEDISISVKRGRTVGLIGPNGSGKSTLVNCICGTLQNEAGTVRFDGHLLDGSNAHQRTRRGLARTFQLPRPFASLSLLDNMRIPLLYTVAARGGAGARRACRGAMRRSPARGGPRRQGKAAAARADPGGNAQARTCARHGGGAETIDRRRIDGRSHRIPRSRKS